MTDFPRTEIDGLSVSRMIIGSNWFLGFSHWSQAKSRYIKQVMDRKAIGDIIEVFMRNGVDTIMGLRPDAPHLLDAIRDAEDRTGRKAIRIATPTLNVADTDEARSESARILDEYALLGLDVCMPHTNCVEQLIDRLNKRITRMETYLGMMRERGMIPGVASHPPEGVIYADKQGLDCQTYVQLYNAAGFLMQYEVDWVNRVIWNAKKPVLTIKPMAAGRLLPIVGFGFSWATIRPQDMVAVGAMTPDEAAEDVEISLAILERRKINLALQKTRSKAALV